MRFSILCLVFFLCACGATTVKYASPKEKIDTIYAKYIADTVWGNPLETKIWRVTKDSVVNDKLVRDTSYYIPQMRYLVDSLNNKIKTKDGKRDSTVTIPFLWPKYLIRQDYGDYYKYIYRK